MTQEMRSHPRVLVLSLLGLALFLAWEAVAMRSYIRVESRPPAWDQAVHLEIALDYKESIRVRDWSGLMHLAPKPGMPPFPPIYHLLLQYACSSPNPAGAALWLNWYYLAVLCIALFALAWHFRPDEAALLGVLAFVSSPAVQDLLYTQLIDLALVAVAAAAYWALLRSDEFRNWAGSLAFGALFAAGMLHKWSFFSYFFPAYYLAVKALIRPWGRLKVIMAILVALAGFMPWYWIHLPVMVPRLFQATADFAVPVWKGGAVLTYMWEAINGLGPLFFILVLVGICVPQYQRNWHQGWLLAAWVLTSCVFWVVVPNRQMRFLLPGLSGLVVAGLGAWPRAVIWVLAGFQFFTMANYTAGWVDPVSIPMPFHTITLFLNGPAAREDWKIAEILQTAERLREPGKTFAGLTLVANAPRFNGPNFNWMMKRLQLEHVRIRGVNRRLCEFSQFVLLKDGKLGPAGVIEGLPEAADVIRDPQGWFQAAYAEAGRWPLPDGTAAVLYQQRRPAEPPTRTRRLQFAYFDTGAFAVSDLALELDGWDRVRSVYRRATFTARAMRLRGLQIDDLRVELSGLRFVPVYGADGKSWEDIRLLSLDKLAIQSARVTGDSLKAFLESRAKGLRVTSLELDKTARLSGTFKNLRVSAELAAELLSDPPRLRLELKGLRLGISSVPAGVRESLGNFVQPFTPTPEMPFLIEAAGLSFSDGAVAVPGPGFKAGAEAGR
ncbi:MAG: glycosyltransferase family 39 protein [Elusimicrobiota bacterium]|jgi:hypothetical protein